MSQGHVALTCHANIHRTTMHLSGTFALSRRRVLAGLASGVLAAPVAQPGSARGTGDAVPRVSGDTASLVLDAETGEVLHGDAVDRPLAPASTLKLLTAVAALDLLGPEHRFETGLMVAGPVEGEALAGDLVLRGTGDPLLDLDHLLALALALRRSGIGRVRGRFLYDETAFPVVPQLVADEPEWAAFNAGVGPLGVAFDRVSLHLRDGRLFTVPQIEAGLRFVPAAEAGPEGIRRIADPSGRTRAWLFAEGAALPAALPVREPGRHAALVFRRFAAALGIDLPPPVPGRTPEGARAVARHESAPVRELVRAMLHHSNNQVAERLGLAAATAVLGRPPADRRHSARVLFAHVAATVEGLRPEGAVVLDHSGLDAGNRLSVAQIGAVLREGWRRFDLPSLLPLSGWSGTLWRRFATPEAALAVAAKSGSLDYASALAGYVLVARRRPRIFVLLADDAAARAQLRTHRPPSPEARRALGAWREAARFREERFVEALLAAG